MNQWIVQRHPFLNEVHDQTLAAVREMAPSAPTNLYEQLAIPPDLAMGHGTIACHFLAKTLRMPPAKIAEQLAQKLNATIGTGQLKWVDKITPVNGYLNFFMKINAYSAHLFKEIKSGELWKAPLIGKEELEKISVEYSQPNTHKALHVGHLRNMVYGDAVCNVLAAVGHNVVRTTYPGDMGAHIAKVLWYISNFRESEIPQHDSADWLGEMYTLADEKVKSFEGKPEELEVKKAIGKILHDLEEGEGPLYPLYKKTRQWSLNQMQRVYDWLGMRFDQWFFESECDKPSRILVEQKFKEGFFVRSEGAIGIDLSPYNLGFALFLRGDGTGLYLTKDLELIRRKFQDPEISRSVVVVDSRQRLHFQQLFKTAELMGYPQAAKSIHLSYEFVTTDDGSVFSSRSKNGLPIEQLRQLIEKTIVEKYLESYRGEWSDAEIQKTAGEICLGALKYGMLKMDANNVIRFVLEDWLRLDGDTGPYLQYSNARCLRILEKVQVATSDTSLHFETETEQALLLHLGRFAQALQAAGTEYRPAVIAAYLYDLCKAFNRFYKECPIKDGEARFQYGRLELVRATQKVLQQGLAFLGIPAPQRM